MQQKRWNRVERKSMRPRVILRSIHVEAWGCDLVFLSPRGMAVLKIGGDEVLSGPHQHRRPDKGGELTPAEEEPHDQHEVLRNPLWKHPFPAEKGRAPPGVLAAMSRQSAPRERGSEKSCVLIRAPARSRSSAPAVVWSARRCTAWPPFEACGILRRRVAETPNH